MDIKNLPAFAPSDVTYLDVLGYLGMVIVCIDNEVVLDDGGIPVVFSNRNQFVKWMNS